MAESFQAVTTSLNEAERVSGKKQWSVNDYENHKSQGNKIEMSRSYLNDVIVSANGRSEKELVNDYFHDKMVKLNDKYKSEVKAWNDEHVGEMHTVKDRKTGEMVEKPYKKKSIDKRRMYPVGEYEKTGKRVLPYDVLKQAIERGNARAKPDDSTHMRTGVLQQYIVGWGNTDEWNKGYRKAIKDRIYSGDNTSQTFKKLLEDQYVKPFLKQFQEENPSLHVMQAVVQYDETNPHLHLTVLPHIDTEQNAGLGSTAFSDVLKHDHPDYDKVKTFDDFYRRQHEVIKQRLNNTNLFNHDLFKPDFRKNNVQKLGVGAPLKRTSKGRSRTNLVNRAIEDKNRQIVWVAEQQQRINKADEQLNKGNQELKLDKDKIKDDSLELIKKYEPKHTVDKDKLKENEEPQPIDTPEGVSQHKRQSITWIHQVAMRVLQRLQEANIALKKKLDARAEAIKTREDNFNQKVIDENKKIEHKRESALHDVENQKKANEDSLQSRENEVSKREIENANHENTLHIREDAVQTREDTMAKREDDVRKRENAVKAKEITTNANKQLVEKIQSENKKMLEQGLHIFYPQLTDYQVKNVATGTKGTVNGKRGYDALFSKLYDQNTAPNPKKRFNNYMNNNNIEQLVKQADENFKKQQQKDDGPTL